MTDGFIRYVDGRGRLSILHCIKGQLTLFVEFDELTREDVAKEIVQALNEQASPGRQKVGEIALPPGRQQTTVTAWRESNGDISLEYWTAAR